MRTNAAVVWRPILLERVRSGAGAGKSKEDDPPSRAAYAVKDLADWARFCGVSIRRPGPYPVAADWAGRGAVAAIDAGVAVPYVEAVFSACFDRGADIDDPDAVLALATDIGLDRTAFRQSAEAAAALRILEGNSDELVARGGFGSPTMFVGNDMYVGNDRMPLVELALTRAADRPFIAPGAHGQI